MPDADDFCEDCDCDHGEIAEMVLVYSGVSTWTWVKCPCPCHVDKMREKTVRGDDKYSAEKEGT